MPHVTGDITTLDITKFNDNLQLLSQQMGSRFRGTTMESSEIGEGVRVVDQIDQVVAVERVSRDEDALNIKPGHDGRWIRPKDFHWGTIVDNIDKLRFRISPEGMYTTNATHAMNRALDDTVITALLGDALTGRDGTTTTAFDTANQQVAATVGAATDTGMNTDKLLEGREIIMAAEVDLDDPNNQLYCAISARQEHELLDQVKVVNTDFQERAVLAGDGRKLRSWFGILFVVTERLETETTGNNDRRCPMWVRSGMHLGVWQDIRGDIRRRNDKSGAPFQVETIGTFNSTRTEEVKVVEILCDEA